MEGDLNQATEVQTVYSSQHFLFCLVVVTSTKSFDKKK
jgi:hypothetical protein